MQSKPEDSAKGITSNVIESAQEETDNDDDDEDDHTDDGEEEEVEGDNKAEHPS